MPPEATVPLVSDAELYGFPLYAYCVEGAFTIAHISDIHCGDPHFVPDLMERAIADINGLQPDIVVWCRGVNIYGFREI